ncbi:MAG: hypothetical protein P8X63_09960 [Desulfuromonadaceae bacterium]
MKSYQLKIVLTFLLLGVSLPAHAETSLENITGVYVSAPDSEGQQILTVEGNGLALLETFQSDRSFADAQIEIFVWKFTQPTLELQMGDKTILLNFNDNISLREHFDLPGSHPGLIPTEKKVSEILGVLWQEPRTFLDDLYGKTDKD